MDAKIAALPERQRLALSLVYFEGINIAAKPGGALVSVDLESLLARARQT